MEVTFTVGAAAGAKANGTQAGPFHGKVEGANTIGAEEGEGSLRGIGIVWLHQDPAHAGTSPIGFQKTRERRVITREAGGRSDGKLQFIPEMSEWRRPHSGRNRPPMVLTLKGAKGFDSDFEEGAVNIVEGEEADERAKRLAVDRERPIRDEIEFRFGGTVAVRGDVVTNVFDSVSEKLAFLQLKSDTVFHENITHTFKETKQ
jgi:hypothetical protein